MNTSAKTLLAIATAFSLAGTAASVSAMEHTMAKEKAENKTADRSKMMPGYGHGMGMMNMMGGGCPMMGGGMMGPGMMGPGMMGGGMGPMAMLDLSDDQTARLNKVQTETQKKMRSVMRQMWEQQGKLNDLYQAEKRDPGAIGKAYGKLADLQRQALEARIEMENKMSEVLTKEQKAQMRRGFGQGMMGN